MLLVLGQKARTMFQQIYPGNGEDLLNYVYSNRMGNGNESSGDGYKYRGRGLIQLTGKANYLEFQNNYNSLNTTQIDIISNPDILISNDNLSIISAMWFFKKKVINRIDIDANTTVEQITLLINGGTIGLQDRKNKFTN